LNYSQTLEWLFEKLPMFQRIGGAAYKADLKNTIEFCAYLGNPERNFKSFHVAGTNGKGSTSHMLSAVLQEHGFKTGLFTSPHLKDFRERMRINGQIASEEFVVEFVENHKEYLEEKQLSFFEMTVGMAFSYFSEQQIDIAVLEVGMGGRLDSTNVVLPEISVITNISFDHQAFLGDTLELIAGEKAGIIKPGIPVVIGEKHAHTEAVFIEKAKLNSSPIYFAQDEEHPSYSLDLAGTYQKKNLQTVLSCLHHQRFFKVDEVKLKSALQKVVPSTGLRGRWEQLSSHPVVYCDTAHNLAGIQLVLKQMETLNASKWHMVWGMVNDKDIDGILQVLPKNATYYFCKPNVPRGKSADELQVEAKKWGLIGEKYDSVEFALADAKFYCADNEMIYVGGSTFVVAEVI